MKQVFFSVLSLVILSVFVSCKEKSSTTGWNYNDSKWGGFEKAPYIEQETGPNLVYIPGGTFTMGQVEQDISYETHAIPRRVTIASFYMDETEVTNLDYRDYLYWLKRVFVSYPEVYEKSLPDTNTWRDRLAYNEPYVRYYLRHPAYNDYPVVGVSWVQAASYAAWRTDRVNEMILVREKILELDPYMQQDEDNFNTEAYLAGEYMGLPRKELKSHHRDEDTRRVQIEDGILLPDYRLPTEAEWEYAALALIGSAVNENVNVKRVYPWNGLSMRKGDDDKYRYTGKFQLNYRRGAGDLMGVASDYNDGAEITAPVRSYWPNDFGLYNMAGNVSEWVKDVYRPLSFEELSDLNPFRGNVFQVGKRDEDGFLAEKDSLGRLQYRDVTLEENVDRRNYKVADNIGFRDPMEYEEREQLYEYGVATLVNNQARVYKGGSWNDRSYWTSPGTRRFLDQDRSLPTLGFRCAMIRVGGSKR